MISTFQISKLLKVKVNEINKTIRRNIMEYKKDIDIVDVKSNTCKFCLDFSALCMNEQSFANSKNVYFLSESGFIKYYSSISVKDEGILNFVLKDYFRSNKYTLSFTYKKEIRFLDILEEALKPFDIKGVRQYTVLKYRIDYYIPSLNIAIEYDENNHKYYSYEEHQGRQKEIEEKIGCRFIRVSDEETHFYNVGYVIKEMFKIN